MNGSVRVEDEEAGQIPMAYVVRAAGSELSEADIIEYVARQVSLSISLNYFLV